MKKLIGLSIIILILASCERPAPEQQPQAELGLITTNLSRDEEYLQSLLQVLFNEFRDAYSEDKNSAKDYFDKTRYLNRLSNELRQAIREKAGLLVSGRRPGEGDLKEIDIQMKEYARKVRIIVKQPQRHSEHSRYVANREMEHLYPVEDWLFNSLNGKTPQELQLFLLSLVNDIYRAEISIGQTIYDDMKGGRKEPGSNNFKLAAYPGEAQVKQGEEARVNLFIQAVYKGATPEFVIGDYDLKTDSILSVTDSKSIVYSNGKAVYTIKDDRKGEHEVQIIAIITDPSGKKIHLPLTYKYTVQR